MKCPLRGTDCREDCAWWIDDACVKIGQYKEAWKTARALEALVKVMQARCK